MGAGDKAFGKGRERSGDGERPGSTRREGAGLRKLEPRGISSGVPGLCNLSFETSPVDLSGVPGVSTSTSDLL